MDKKQISEHLLDALIKEDLHTREAAKFLNLNPCYVSMARNPNQWDSMGKTPWLRLEEWHLTRGKISDFQIPEREEIWKPKENNQDTPKKHVIKHKKQILQDSDEHSPEHLSTGETHPFVVEKLIPPPETNFTDTARLKVALDIEINLVVNGQKIQIR